MIIAREEELRRLHEAAESEYSQFIAVYGRRRIGKTFLIREAFNYHFTFEHAGLAHQDKEAELAAFCNSLAGHGLEVGEAKPQNWLDAFELLKKLIRESGDTKKVIFIDELSWMDTPGSDLVAALEAFWNGWASARKDVVLIVCASATSWMMDEIIHNKGGLYNRLNLQIGLKPFTLKECEEYLQAMNIVMSRQDILEGYMVFGGVPFYWSLLRKDLSLAQNIDALFFAESAPLKNEFSYLYASLFDNPTKYIEVITALGKKKIGMTRQEIAQTTSLFNSGILTGVLEDLENCGFIRGYTEFGKKKKGEVFQLIDNFTLFHFKFLETPPTDEHFWVNTLNTPGRNSWCGLAFERVCLEHVPQIKQKLGISGVLTETHSWQCKEDPDKGVNGSQIDLLIVRQDRVINVCEAKYSSLDYTITKAYDMKLREKIHDFQTVTRTRNTIHLTLITTYGLKQNAYSGSIQSVVTAEDLFA